jgi:hypothetical protein
VSARRLNDVARVDHLRAKASDVALVDAELSAKILLGELASTQQDHERVGVGHRQRFAAWCRVPSERAKHPEEPLHEKAKLVHLVHGHPSSMRPIGCVRN